MSTVLNQHVLVLNRLWQAVNVCTARRALTLLFQGHAQVVLNRSDGSFQTFSFTEWHDLSQQEPHPESVRTVSFRIRVPRVILLMLYGHMPKKEVKFPRHNIFERDKNTCQYCGKAFDRKDLNLDHVVPRDRGGPTSWENIVCSCIDCNTLKANRTPHELHQGWEGQFGSVNGAEVVADYGDRSAEYRALREAAGILDLSFRGRICLTGEDRVRFL